MSIWEMLILSSYTFKVAFNESQVLKVESKLAWDLLAICSQFPELLRFVLYLQNHSLHDFRFFKFFCCSEFLAWDAVTLPLLIFSLKFLLCVFSGAPDFLVARAVAWYAHDSTVSCSLLRFLLSC